MPSKTPSSRSKTTSRPVPQPDASERAEMAARQKPYFVIGLIVVYFVLAAAYNRLIPFETGARAAAEIHNNQLPVNPDEAAHVGNAFAYRSGHLPVFQAGSPNFEAHQPPLYYVLVSAVLRNPAHTDQPAAAARWLSILMGAGLIWAIRGAVRAAFPDRPYLADASACAGLLPTNINLCASISNDVLTNLVVALSLWQLVRVCQGARLMSRPHLAVQSLLLGVLLAIGLYTKTSTLVMFPAVIVAAWLCVRWQLLSAAGGVMMAGISLGAAVLIASPWLVRNTLVYGDPLAQHIFQSAFSGTTATTGTMLRQWPLWKYAWIDSEWTFQSFFAVFDAMQLFLPGWVYAILGLAVIASRVGLTNWWKRVQVTTAQRVILAVFTTVTIVTLVAFVRFNATFFQAQGRYLYTALVPLAFSLAAGVGGLAPKGNDTFPQKMPAYIAGAILLLNAFSIMRINAIFGSGG